MQKNCSVLTFRGTEKFAVRMMASAIAWAYQGYNKNKFQNIKELTLHVCVHDTLASRKPNLKDQSILTYL